MRTRIAICIPCYGTITAHWFIKFMTFLKANQAKYDISLHLHEQQPVSMSRNTLVKEALNTNPDYIFFIDSDNVIPDRAIDKLIQTMESEKAKLCSGLYFAKDPPYFPVLREYRKSGFWTLDNVDIGKTIEIGGCGFGCVLVKTEVFRELSEPWFMFSHEKLGERDIVLGEDLYFCRKMIEKGMKQVADCGVISSHIGGKIEVQEHLAYSNYRTLTQVEREGLIEDLMEFTGKDRNETDIAIAEGQTKLAREWNDKKPLSPQTIEEFYRETPNYIYDLTSWHFGERRQFDIDLVKTCLTLANGQGKTPDQIKILDYGCGIGQNAIMLAQMGFKVTMADLQGVTFEFAQFRNEKRNLGMDLWRVNLEDAPKEKYDIILALDVLEHIPPEDFKKTIDTLIALKAPNANVFTTTQFKKTESHPMHFDSTEEQREQMKRLIKESPQ